MKTITLSHWSNKNACLVEKPVKSKEKGDFHLCLECVTSKPWSKYTTNYAKGTGSLTLLNNSRFTIKKK